MKVWVLLFAGLRERAGAAELALADVPDGESVGELLARVRAAHPSFARVPILVARAQQIVDVRTRVADGDELAFLPPVSGG